MVTSVVLSRSKKRDHTIANLSVGMETLILRMEEEVVTQNRDKAGKKKGDWGISDRKLRDIYLKLI